ncbi:hypothetical protein CAAN1_06S03334 [[Candida] anglica]|uniref:Uncharacterized protein n=1 Tax=[Candida] anglica TaxID=148631 RepID=A0ABP0EQ59_9ASCO
MKFDMILRQFLRITSFIDNQSNRLAKSNQAGLNLHGTTDSFCFQIIQFIDFNPIFEANVASGSTNLIKIKLLTSYIYKNTSTQVELEFFIFSLIKVLLIGFCISSCSEVGNTISN